MAYRRGDILTFRANVLNAHQISTGADGIEPTDAGEVTADHDPAFPRLTFVGPINRPDFRRIEWIGNAYQLRRLVAYPGDQATDDEWVAYLDGCLAVHQAARGRRLALALAGQSQQLIFGPAEKHSFWYPLTEDEPPPRRHIL